VHLDRGRGKQRLDLRSSPAAPVRDPRGFGLRAGPVAQGKLLAHELLAEIPTIDDDVSECPPELVMALPPDFHEAAETHEFNNTRLRRVARDSLLFATCLAGLRCVYPEEPYALAVQSESVAIDHVDLARIDCLALGRQGGHTKRNREGHQARGHKHGSQDTGVPSPSSILKLSAGEHLVSLAAPQVLFRLRALPLQQLLLLSSEVSSLPLLRSDVSLIQRFDCRSVARSDLTNCWPT
jgi:hypothetical protein